MEPLKENIRMKIGREVVLVPLTSFREIEVYCPKCGAAVSFDGRDISKPIPWSCPACGTSFGLEHNGLRVAAANFKKFLEQMETLGLNAHFRFTEPNGHKDI
jgi:hypothetical protein